MVPYVPNLQITNMHAQMGTHMVPFQPYYSDHCSVGSMNQPPYSGSVHVPVPPLPPPPSGGNSNNGNGSINSHSGEVGQQLGGNKGFFHEKEVSYGWFVIFLVSTAKR